MGMCSNGDLDLASLQNSPKNSLKIHSPVFPLKPSLSKGNPPMRQRGDVQNQQKMKYREPNGSGKQIQGIHRTTIETCHRKFYSKLATYR